MNPKWEYCREIGIYIKINSIKYHRNGITGAPFYRIDMLYNEQRKIEDAISLISLVFTTDKYCAIIDATDPTSCWRGDNFESFLRDAIGKYEQSFME